nr:double-stranded RNA-binding protein 4-like [Coffea arabica]
MEQSIAHNSKLQLLLMASTLIHLAFLNEEAIVEGSKTERRLKGRDINSNALSNEAGPDIEQALKDGAINSSEDEVQQNYKRKLQKYAQTKKLDLPLYRTKRVEQSDALCFTAKVLVGEDIFESPGFYETTKDAEDAAAQAALTSLTMDAFRKSDDNMYKNLLQEFAQENGFFLPKYKTMKSGEDHKSTFFSTVEVEGEIFHGNQEKSKKLAEFSAAKIAHTALMLGKSCLMDDNTSISSKDDILEVAPSLDSLTIGDQQRNANPGTQADESKDSLSKKTTEDINTYLLCNRVRVYTCIPEMIFSKGNVALPIAEGKWAVVNLEFPNEKDA